MLALGRFRPALIGLVLAGFSVVGLRAQDTNYLFIVSEPMGARVTLDGKALEHPSPLLLRDLAPGPHRFRFEKDGWFSQDVAIVAPRAEALRVALVPKAPLLFVEGQTLRFSSPALTLKSGRGGIEAAPDFPRQKALDGVNFALPLFLGLSAVLTLREIYSPRESTFIISPELAASALIGGGLLAWDIDLQIRRFNFLNAAKPRIESWKSLSLAAELRFEAASQTLLGGNFDSALAQFKELVKEYPDEEILPKALFEIGRILFVKADIQGAEEAFRRVADDYPLPELHDRARKGLADCLIALGDRRGALAQLDLLTYNGAGLTREEVELYRQSF